MDTNLNTNPSGSSSKRRIMIIASVVFVLILAVVSVLVLSQKPPQQAANDQNTLTQDSTTGQKVDKTKASNSARPATAPPEVTFTNWTGLQQPPGLPATLNVYPLKQSFTMDDARALAQKLKTTGYISKKNNVVTAYKLGGNTSSSVLLFNVSSGEFSYRSSNGIALPAQGTLEEKTYAFLRLLGWYDPTIQVTATYKNNKKPGLLYVELHRKWDNVGAPILNPIGMFNIPEDQNLASLTLNTTVPNTPKDADIIATSDNRNGFARATDFNTITLAINEGTQSVNMIKSNIRPASSVASASSLISYDQAVKKLKEKEYSFIFTSPTGEGEAINWEKMYPANAATSDEAVVTESTVAYLENQPTSVQKTLEPYYIFRGYAKLTSGYRVMFTAAVPASVKSAAKAQEPVVAGVMAQDTTQKQGTFDGVVQPTIAASSEQIPANIGTCQPSAAELAPVYDVNSLKFGWASYTYWKGEYRDSKGGYWYYIPDASTTAGVVESNLDTIIAALQQATPKADIRDEKDKIIFDINNNVSGGQRVTDNSITPTIAAGDDTSQKQGTFDLPTQAPLPTLMASSVVVDPGAPCPVRLTGSSPTVFVYGTLGSTVELTPVTTYTYADPGVAAGKWNVTVQGLNSLTVNGLARPYIYYEYQKVAFARPEKGWTVKRAALDLFVRNTIAPRLGLTAEETERAQFELNHAAADVAGDRVFVGLVDVKELNSKVPLKVSGASARRVHFYVGKVGGTVAVPTLAPVTRTGTYVLELGSHAE